MKKMTSSITAATITNWAQAQWVSVLLLMVALLTVMATTKAIAALEPLSEFDENQFGLQSLTDSELSDVSGQALFQTQKLVGDNSQANGSSGYTFYRVGLDATLDLNMNVKNLELGRTSGNSGDIAGVDLMAENVAFGCVADAGGNCVDSESGSATQLKPVELTRPYLEFAIKNDGTATQREVVGIRLGGENISGPISFGKMQVFSGFLSATAQLTMEGMNDVASTCGTDALGITGGGQTVFSPYSGGCPGGIGGGLAGTGVNTFSGTHNTTNTNQIDVSSGQFQYTASHLYSAGYNGTRGSLGLANDDVCTTVLLITLCAELATVTVNFPTRSTGILDVVANGSRLTQAQVLNPGLATLVNNITANLTIEQCTGDAIVCFGAGLIPALVRGPAADAFKQQICSGLSISPCNDSNLNTTPVPFNLDTFHSQEFNSPNLGLTFQREALRYPGFALASGSLPEAVMQPGWSMYFPDAFFLPVSEPAAVFTNNIANGNAGAGYLVGLDPVYDNCWGAAQFC